MKLIAKQDFSYSTNGYTLTAYPKGTEIDTDDQGLIDVAVGEGWAESPAKKAPENKARKAAPESK